MSEKTHFDCLIVGGGHAGAQAAILLRQLGFEGSVGLIGADKSYPYERPPLSKDYLAGEKPFDRILLRPASFWTERGIELMLGQRVKSVDPVAHEVQTAAGETVGYGKLIWAGGGVARPLSCSGSAAKGVHSIRTRNDADALIAALPDANRIVVIGGGYIGLEAAAVFVKLGKQVTLIEARDRLLSRSAGKEIADFYAEEHRAHGVDLHLGASVEAIETDANDRATAVRLSGGETVGADLVVVGIGIVPEVGPLLLAGASGGDGVDVDSFCLTTLDDIYAVGDCAAHENVYSRGNRIRLESVQNANDQARTAVQHIIGDPQPYEAMPWFWSNQYDLKLQTVGISLGHDSTVLRGDPASKRFSVIYLREGQVLALDCVNATRDYVQGRALILSGTKPDPDALANPDIPLKELASA